MNKKALIFASCILLCSCILVDNKKEYDNYNNIIKNSHNYIGKSTNYDIIRGIKPLIPNEKFILYNDGKHSLYSYRVGWISSFSSFTFENDILCGINGYTIVSSKNELISRNIWKCKNKQWDASLAKWNNLEYKFIDIEQSPDINIKTISSDEFLKKIKPGIRKGSLFRIIGRPDYSYKDKNEERWRFTVTKSSYVKGILQFNNKGILNTKLIKEYFITMKDDTVVDRYVNEYVDFTKEEKDCMAQNSRN